jgi:hypothetical protein
MTLGGRIWTMGMKVLLFKDSPKLFMSAALLLLGIVLY